MSNKFKALIASIAVAGGINHYPIQEPEMEFQLEMGDPIITTITEPFLVTYSPIVKRTRGDYILASSNLETLVQKDSINYRGSVHRFPFISPISPEDRPLPWKQYEWNKAREKKDKEGNVRTVYHRAADIPVPNGTPVYAPANGEVSTLFFNDEGRRKSAGWTIEIKHPAIKIDGKETKSVFMHLGIPYKLPKGKSIKIFQNDFDPSKYKLFVKKGDTVRKGQLIACSGNTGTRDEHLHAELYKGKERIDPRPLYIHTQKMMDTPEEYYFRVSDEHTCD